MGLFSKNKPKASDYKPSEAEKTSASVALHQYRQFKENYGPVQDALLRKAENQNMRGVAKGRANADVAQTLTSDLTMEKAKDIELASGYAPALAGNLMQAAKKAADVKNEQS
jgi:hypothetical protein